MYFLEKVIALFKLKDITVINARIEELKTVEKYDYIVSRALGETRQVLELSSKILKIGGKLILFKGPSYNEELTNSEKAIKKLGFRFQGFKKYELSNNLGVRVYLVFEKIKKTPTNYPRKFSQIKKHPL